MDRRLFIAGAVAGGAVAAPALAQETSFTGGPLRGDAERARHRGVRRTLRGRLRQLSGQRGCSCAARRQDAEARLRRFFRRKARRHSGPQGHRGSLRHHRRQSGGELCLFGTHGGTYFGIAPTGRPLRFTSCDIFLVRNGLIAEHWGMGDIAGSWLSCGRERGRTERSGLRLRRSRLRYSERSRMA